MGLTNFPNGIASFGVPQPSGGIPMTTGSYFFVHSGTGSNGNSGGSPSGPLATVVKAYSLCTTAKNDVIILMPGHAENISSAAYLALSKSGVQFHGLGTGRLRPTFTWTTTDATITGNAANNTFRNCVFVLTGIDAVVTPFAVTAGCDGLTFDGCEFDCAIASFVALVGIKMTGVDRFTFINNHVHGRAVANMTNFIQIVGAAGKGLDYVIAGNHIQGNYTTTLGAINNITVALLGITVRDNVIVNNTTSSTKCVVLLTGSSGIVANNRFGIKSGAAPVTGDAVHWVGNWSAAAVATDSTLV